MTANTGDTVDWLTGVELKLKRGNKILFAKDCELFAELNDGIARESHKVVALWALELAASLVDALKERYPDEPRPMIALEASRAWAAGEVKMREAQRAILDCHAFAKDIDSPEDIALCHAIGQACGTVHASGHAMGLPIYELTSVVHRFGIYDCRKAVENRMAYYRERLSYWHEHSGDYRGKWAGFMEA